MVDAFMVFDRAEDVVTCYEKTLRFYRSKDIWKPCEFLKISLVFFCLPVWVLLWCDPIQQFCIWIQILYSVILCVCLILWCCKESANLKMKAVQSFEILGTTNSPTQSYIQMDLNLLRHCCENLTSCIFVSVIQVSMSKIFT